MTLKRIFLSAYVLMLLTVLYAQPQPSEKTRPAPPKLMTPTQIAQKQADMMKAEINLTDKQYKKVYKLIKKDHEYRQSQAQSQFGGMPPQGGGMGGPGGGFGGGMPPQGGSGGGFGGGMPPQGGGMGAPAGDFGGGMPPQGGGMGAPAGDFGGGMPPQGGGMGGPGGFPGDIVTDEYLEKQDQKLKKILSDEQYTKWRAKHPAEHLELPPVMK